MGTRVLKYRGLADAIEQVLNNHPGRVFDGKQLLAILKSQEPDRWRGLTARAVAHGAYFLTRNDRAHKPRYGHYQAGNGKAEPEPAVLGDEALIDDLLAAMAKAEPVLRRYKRLIQAVRGDV